MKQTCNVKRIFSLMLSICMVLSLMPGIAQAAGTEGMITIEMTDTGYDGWNGNAIEIYADGELIDAATLRGHVKTGTWTMERDIHTTYSLKWRKGENPNETRFAIYVDDMVAEAGGSSYIDGWTILTVEAVCQPEYKDGICVNCGIACAHTVGGDGICTKCAYVCAHSWSDGVCTTCGGSCRHESAFEGACELCGAGIYLTLNMEDYPSDGWTGNAITVYANGNLVGVATMEAGTQTATWSAPYDSYMTYTFEWTSGKYPYDCSFSIVANGEEKYYADNYTCQDMENGLFFTLESVCPHEVFNEDFYCTACGKPCRHSLDENQVCTICGKAPCNHEYTYACDRYCVLCGELTNPNAFHNVIHVDAVGATCYENGNIEYWYCSDCGACWLDENLSRLTNRMSVITYQDHNYINNVCEYCGDVLLNDIKWQVNAGATATDASVSLRLISYVDNLSDYSKVEFVVCFFDDNGDYRETTLTCTTVYEALNANGQTYTVNQIFGQEDANYIVTYTINGWPNIFFDNDIYVYMNRYDLNGELVSSADRAINLANEM